MKSWRELLITILMLATAGLAIQCVRLEAEADAAEAHAKAADDRAGACEAKFSYSTVLVMPGAGSGLMNQPGNINAPGVNLYHGIIRLSLNTSAILPAGGASPAPTAASAPVPMFIVPAKITPQSYMPDSGASYYWIDNRTHAQRGPYTISQAQP